MYISQGKFKHYKLPIINSDLRPCTGAIRRFIFSVLDFKTYKVLDLFAGTGSLGFEALSAGAEYAVFIDQCKHSILQISKFIQKYQLNAKAIYCNVLQIAKLNMSFDYLFLDPPYNLHIIESYCKKAIINNLINLNGIIVAKTNYKLELDLHLIKEKNFGESIVSIWQT